MSGLAVAILAAGRSARFGAEDKLTAKLRGMPLGLHTANALAGLNFAQRWVIVRAPDHPCVPDWRAVGFEPLVNAAADTGMGASLRLAAQCAEHAGADGLMVCLADMPLVPSAHFEALTHAWRQRGGVIASQDGVLIAPPAIFSRAHFPLLAGVTGDQGGRPLLNGAFCVTAPSGTLEDVDDPATLLRLSA